MSDDTIIVPGVEPLTVITIPGLRGRGVDHVTRVGDAIQFYAEGSPVGAPISLLVSSCDGGTPTTTGDGFIDGGTP